MRRREFLGVLSGAAATWPLGAFAQQTERMRRVGVLITLAEGDPGGRARIKVLQDGLRQAGWIANGNIKIDYRWSGADVGIVRKQAAELAALAPDVILAHSGPALIALQQTTRSIPIVFVQVVDPVGNAFVESLARPGGNITGFLSFEYSIAGKWLELLKIIAPQVTKVAVIRDAAQPSGIGQLAAVQAMAQSTGIALRAIGMRDLAEMEREVQSFAREPNAGIIVTASPTAAVHRKRIVALAMQHRLPTVYYYSFFVREGGLISYGVDLLDLWHRAAGYLDRVLRGEKPADLPVQGPVKFELAINLRTAKALGLAVPVTLLARADEVIE